MLAQKRGLARLMLRLPEFRNRFVRMQDLRFRGFCEEYDVVWEVITRWSQDTRCSMFSLDDYRRLATSIESDAIAMAEAVPVPGAIARAAKPQVTQSASPEDDSQTR
ncbi:hypothetical protein [Bosea sp. BIWAKO-01]|uniref:hypothetical protein n=1 Tax=Bosea sp. BIWAKO-01 TaxID=506668 RepID=UPI00085355A1|nr:hypothetical protein [Bosea sp. BIWAKO-01]